MEKFISGFNQSFIEGDRWLMYVKGIGVTLEVAAVALLLGIVLGVIVAIVRTLHDQQRPRQKHALLEVINKIAQLYTTVIRGTPLMVQLLIMYFVIFANTRNAVGVAMLTFGINSGAYVAEIIRGGIMSVDKGQMEAARSLGLSYVPAMRFVVIPQAIKNILPALGNELIALLKDTSLVTVIGVRDLTKAAQLIQGKTYQALFPFVGIAIVYLLMVMIIAALIGVLERRLAASDRR